MLTDIEEFYRLDRLPHIWCPGCGNGIVLACLVKAIKELKYDQNKTVVISGIGCSSRASAYLDFNTLHTTHGRALAFATGIKLAKPELNIFVITGDGDSSAIGGNHLIHAARRNIDLNVVIFNNSIYGMTGGQYSPLTPKAKKATTAPYGTIERPFDLAKLVEAAGATYVARSTAYHTRLTTDLIVNGAKHKGFSVTEVISQCPVSFGRRNRFNTPAAMLEWQRETAVPVKKARSMAPEELEGKIITGELYRGQAPEYVSEYTKLTQRLKEEAEGYDGSKV